MSTTIFHEGTELRAAARQMSTVIGSMNQIQSAISRIDNSVASVWQGRAAAQNQVNFNALNAMTTEYLTDARETQNALDLAVAAYQRTEQTQVGNVSQLSTRGIF